MRCPDCNKFVGQDPGEPEVQSIEINNGEVQIEARLPVTCNECGNELKEGTFTMEETIPSEIADAHEGEGHELEVEEDDCEAVDEYQTTDRHGKPIKSVRYQKHLYGVRVGFSVTCSCQAAGAEPLFSGEVSDTMPAGAMDELV